MFKNDKKIFSRIMEGISQQTVAKKLEMSQGQISNWLNGKTPISEQAWLKILTKLKNKTPKLAREELAYLKIEDAEYELSSLNKNKKTPEANENRVLYGRKTDLNDFIPIPFLGKVKCGDFDEINFETEEKRMIHKKNLSRGKKYIMLEAQGISMQGAGIEEGDELLVCLNCVPRKGDICLFEIRGEIVVGYYFKKGESVEVRKAHKDYPPLNIDDSDFRVLGVINSVLRTFRSL